MRKIDKIKRITKLNTLIENKYLVDKGLILEEINGDVEKIKIIAKIELLEFLNATYNYPKEYKNIHEAYILELKNKIN